MFSFFSDYKGYKKKKKDDNRPWAQRQSILGRPGVRAVIVSVNAGGNVRTFEPFSQSMRHDRRRRRLSHWTRPYSPVQLSWNATNLNMTSLFPDNEFTQLTKRSYKNWVFATISDLPIPLSLQPNDLAI